MMKIYRTVLVSRFIFLNVPEEDSETKKLKSAYSQRE